MKIDNIYYGVSSVIVFALVWYQYLLATGTRENDGSTALLFVLTLILVVYKTAEVLYLAIKNPVPPRPHKMQSSMPAGSDSDITIKTPVPGSDMMIATDIKVPVPPRPRAMYFFATGIFVVSVFILYYISILRIEAGIIENLIRGLFIMALLSHLIGTAALFSRSNLSLTISQEIQ